MIKKERNKEGRKKTKTKQINKKEGRKEGRSELAQKRLEKSSPQTGLVQYGGQNELEEARNVYSLNKTLLIIHTHWQFL